MTKKYRCKINTPWFSKGQILYTNSNGDLVLEKSVFSGMCYPDLFEPVEEISNKEKWDKIISHISKVEKRYFELSGIFDNFPIDSQNVLKNYDYPSILDSLGYNADNAYEYIVEGRRR